MGLFAVGCGGSGSSGSDESAVVPSFGYHPPRQSHRHREHHHRERADAVPAGVNPITAEEFYSYQGTDRGNWEIAYEVCGSTSEKQLAREFHTEENWAAIGHAYGAGYREPFDIPAEEGCMAGIKDSESEWEAAVEGLPFKEL